VNVIIEISLWYELNACQLNTYWVVAITAHPSNYSSSSSSSSIWLKARDHIAAAHRVAVSAAAGSTTDMASRSCPAAIAVAELADVNDFVASQVSAGLSRDDVVDALYRSWSTRLLALARLGEKQKTLITAAISGGPWSVDQRKELARVLLVGPEKQSIAARRPNQKCVNFENFVPEDLFLKLRDARKFSPTTRASLVAALGQKLGIECPDQPTLYRMVSLMAYCSDTYDMPQATVHDLMDKIQSFLKASPRKSRLPYVEHYPCSASMLPTEIQESAYPDGVLPVDVNIPELAVILGDARMRGRSSSKAAPAWLQHVPDEYKALVMSQINRTRGSPSASPDRDLPLRASPAPATAAALPGADVLRFKFRNELAEVKRERELAEVKREPLAETGAAEAAPAAVAALAAEKPADAGTVEEMEKAFVAAAAPRKAPSKSALKRPSAAPAKKPVKKAAGAAPKSMKAAPMKAATLKAAKKFCVDMTDVFNVLRTRGKQNRNQFTSHAYHTARARVRAAGAKPEGAKVFARAQAAKASALWLSLQKK
jgi:hypothetical protein